MIPATLTGSRTGIFIFEGEVFLISAGLWADVSVRVSLILVVVSTILVVVAIVSTVGIIITSIILFCVSAVANIVVVVGVDVIVVPVKRSVPVVGIIMSVIFAVAML